MKSKIVAESLAMIGTAFGLVAALAWNEAVKSLINEFLPKKGQGVLPLFIYAVAVTVIAVVAIGRIMKLKEKFENDPHGRNQA